MDDIGKRLGKEDAELKAATQDMEQMKRELVSIIENIKEYEEEMKDLKDMLAKADNRGNSAQTQ
jgi:predicted  nucleic acid-binding Zn-ribbon protein